MELYDGEERTGQYMVHADVSRHHPRIVSKLDAIVGGCGWV